MMDVTDSIRLELRLELVRQGVSRAELARRTGLTANHVSALLNGRRGRLAEAWENILDGLGLELVVRPRGQASPDL